MIRTYRTYRITNTTSGLILGTYGGDDEQGALDALASDAGYRDANDVDAQAGEADLLVEEVTEITIAIMDGITERTQDVELTGDEYAAAVAKAVKDLSAHGLGDGRYVYRAEETGRWYEAYEDDLAHLGAGYDYSLWCAGFGSEADASDIVVELTVTAVENTGDDDVDAFLDNYCTFDGVVTLLDGTTESVRWGGCLGVRPSNQGTAWAAGTTTGLFECWATAHDDHTSIAWLTGHNLCELVDVDKAWRLLAD